MRANHTQREPVALDQRLIHTDPDDNTSVVELKTDADMKLLERGQYSLVFGHPEAIISSSEGFQLMQSVHYLKNVQVVVVDEAHCILEW